jgi:3,4-dihydroxy 2-butanone 4-phosphate synthase/GTP cyclohydrolase II
MAFNTTEELIEEFRRGRMVVLVDDEDRENEGDLVMPAELVTPESINFMATHGRGLVCMPLTRERCEQLGLWLMVRDNREAHHTKFTVSIDAARGVTTGISAADRARTVRDSVAPHAGPADFVQPGHIFPLQCEPGGVLSRAGHTEAGCDLARLAGLEPAAVLVEILNEDGSMARRPELERFAAHHELKIGTIADLINYRMLNEKTVARVGECALPTRHGAFRLVSFQETVTRALHFALVRGDIDPEHPTLVRVHVQDSLCDLTHSERDDCGWPVGEALARLQREGSGVLVVLRHEERPDDLIHRIARYAREDAGEKVAHPEPIEDLRTYGVGAQILLDLGVRRMRVLSAPKRLHGLSGFRLEVVEYVS